MTAKLHFLAREMGNALLLPICVKTGKCLLSPTIAVLFLTQRCNSRCRICGYWKQTDFSRELTTREWKQAIDQLKSSKVKLINFTADGELFVRSDALEIMRYARNRGFPLTINTNGLALGRHIPDILDLDPLQIQISLDAFDDVTYEKIRGVPKGFTRVKNNIEHLLAAGFRRISVGSVLTRENLDHLLQIQDFCNKNSLSFRITAFQFRGFGQNNAPLKKAYRKKEFLDEMSCTLNRIMDQPVNNTPLYLESINHYFTKDKFHPLDCVVGHYKVFILPDGDLLLCNLMRQAAKAGNIREQSLSAIWKSKKARQIRKNIQDKKCPSCWLSCFAEDNIRFSLSGFLKNAGYFGKKAFRLLIKPR